ncbi:hypothetical protein HQ545_08240 [Candidatus Woesearchaeota archaeon]|nr:hypothetical protein [Candidatus Woesearchaeota archaeon]
MISIDEQQSLLLNISKGLKKKITVYAIGGTAMMFLGIKDTTLDIDLVFDNNEDKEAFKDAAKEIGYKELDGIEIYGARPNIPDMLKLKDERFDLFVDEVIDFVFSQEMKNRAEQTIEFEGNLTLNVANPQDIVLMKCATDRAKDKDDARKIIETSDINWDIVIEEAKNQIKLGKEKAYFELGCFLEELKEKLGVPVPQEVLDKLFTLVQEQAAKKTKGKTVKYT